MADDSCPSCGKNTKEKAGTDPNKVLVGIGLRERLPGICHSCGVPTRIVKRIKVDSDPQNPTMVSGVSGFVGHFIKPLGFINMMERINKTVRLSLNLPTCKQCARSLRRITLHYVDFDARRIDLVVHVEFKKAMDQNGRN